jgi:hypothetical protein
MPPRRAEITSRHGNKVFSPEVVEQMIDLAKTGSTNTILAASVGVSVDTVQLWIKKGRDELRQHLEEDPDAEFIFEDLSEYGQFVYRLEKERAELASALSGKVIEAAMSGQPNTWQAAMTFLERRYPAEWGKRETRVHEGNMPSSLPPINILVLNDADTRSAHRDLLRSVDRANRARTGLAIGPGVGDELEAASGDGRDVLDVDSR